MDKNSEQYKAKLAYNREYKKKLPKNKLMSYLGGKCDLCGGRYYTNIWEHKQSKKHSNKEQKTNVIKLLKN